MKHTARCLLLGTALLASLPALAQYSWIDNTGHRVFSDQPPPADIPQKNIFPSRAAPVSAATPTTPAAPVAPASPASAASGQDQALEDKKKAADAAEAAKKKAAEQKLAAQRADSCQRAKTNLTGLQSGVRITQFDAQGQRAYMTDDQRTAEIQRIQGIIQSDCH